MKTCRLCKIEKALDCFRVYRGHMRGECRECEALQRRQDYAKNPAKYAEAARKWAREHPEHHAATKKAWREKNPEKHEGYTRKVLYGITPEEFRRLLELQKGCCAICGGPPVGRKNLSVDHCHTTGRIRGLLCGLCNTGIGNLKDSPELLEKAAQYLRQLTISSSSNTSS